MTHRYGLANQTMSAYEQKVQESTSSSVDQAVCLSWSSIHARIPKKQDLMNLQLSQEQAGKRKKLPSSISLYGLPVEGVKCIRGGPYYLNRSCLKLYLLTSKIWIRSPSSHTKLSKNPSQLCLSILEFGLQTS